MARRKKPGLRTKSGRLSRAYAGPRLRDYGTEEVQAKRRDLVGPDADDTLAATMPGILFGRGYLDKEQYAEALEYRQLRCALYGPPWPSYVTGGEASEERLERLKVRFERRVALLSQVQKIVISNVCVHDQEPLWFCRRKAGLCLRAVDELEHRALIEGLNKLIGCGHKRSEQLTMHAQLL